MNREDFLEALHYVDAASYHGDPLSKEAQSILTCYDEQRAEIERLTSINADHELNKPVLVQEIELLQARLRATAQLGIAEIGAEGPEDAESVVGRMVARIQQLQAQLATAKGEVVRLEKTIQQKEQV